MGLAQKPDVVCLTGDFINDGGEEYNAGDFARILRRLSEVAPTLGVLGNHDGGLWAGRRWGKPDTKHIRGILDKAQIHLLHNANHELGLPGGRVTFAGVGDLWAKEVEPEAAFDGVTDQGQPIVVLAHNPDTKDMFGERYPWHLMLSGHTHGGQVRVPFYGTPFAPVKDQRYVEGLKQWGNRWIQVSRGIGVTVPIRLNCRPQVSVIDLVPLGAEV
jgi:predicted MPP superfamily phosphohydrolase